MQQNFIFPDYFKQNVATITKILKSQKLQICQLCNHLMTSLTCLAKFICHAIKTLNIILPDSIQTKSRNVLIQGRYIFKNRILRKQFCASTYSFLLRQQVMQLHTQFWRHIHRIFNEAMHQNTLVEELCTTVQVIKAV